jgi:hypothetical protein
VVLHSELKRRAARDAAEAAGADLWLDEVPSRARVKIAALWTTTQRASGIRAAAFQHGIRQILEREAGRRFGPNAHIGSDTLATTEDTDLALDLIGAFYMYVDQAESLPAPAFFELHVNEVFEDFRVAYRMVDGDVLPVESDELHKEVVEPALRLLVGDTFDAAKKAYIAAIKEVPADPSNAITDAGTALQETLKALGCDGNALGPLIKSAKAKGLLAPHDRNLEAGIKSFLEWASADRSETGDGHKVTDATRADAWLMIHVVGALIVRLADSTPRSTTP